MFHVVYYSVPRISVVSVHSSSSQSVSQYQNYEDMVSLVFRSAELAVVVDYSAPGMSIARVSLVALFRTLWRTYLMFDLS